MMNYEIFKEVVKDSFKDYLPEQYKDMELRVCSVNKVNRMMDGINLIGESEVKCNFRLDQNVIKMLMVLDKRVRKCKIVKHRNLRGGYRYYDGSAMY